jgi:hypothetical protein
MAMHIERLNSEVSVNEGALGLTPQQTDQLVALVISKLEERAREAQRMRGATQVKRSAAAPLGAGH